MSASAEDVCDNSTPTTAASELSISNTHRPTPSLSHPISTSSDASSTSSMRSNSCLEDNTAAGMACSQEDSMYVTPATSPARSTRDDKESIACAADDSQSDNDTTKHLSQTQTGVTTEDTQLCSMLSNRYTATRMTPEDLVKLDGYTHQESSERNMRDEYKVKSEASLHSAQQNEDVAHLPRGLAKVDLELNRYSQIPMWDMSDKPPVSKYPSSLFRPYAKYTGTQQSDRQIYNVEVTILTVDMKQCSLSGYLQIRGLTPDHETLQTYFTGEIIGGPDHKHSFRTRDRGWGADDKIDLHHWLRFPSWRQYSVHAKRNMDFEFPLDDESWWEQENVYMRWKEHFLVPDHRQRNIQGASFEGFYYICLNQIRGSISGVYFHKASERYQKLELRHSSKQDIWIPEVSPVVEFR